MTPREQALTTLADNTIKSLAEAKSMHPVVEVAMTASIIAIYYSTRSSILGVESVGEGEK